MDYEKKYKEALGWIQSLYNGLHGKTKEEAERYFPELKESEDEKMIIAIKEAVSNYWSDDSQAKTDILAWLEKQGEQKEIDYNKELEKCKANPLYFFDKYVKVKFKEQNHTDKVEPKYKACDWIDLGLPSGTLWKSANEEGYYTYDEAASAFGDQLPTKKQFEELEYKCTWEWKGKGYKVTGPNGNSIFLPALGFRTCNGSVGNVETYGYYVTSSPYNSDNAWRLYFYSSEVGMYYNLRCFEHSIRLVKNK